MLQMAQIILFIASVAFNSLCNTANRHRGTVQQISASVYASDENAAGGDNAYLSHTSCDYE